MTNNYDMRKLGYAGCWDLVGDFGHFTCKYWMRTGQKSKFIEKIG